MNDLDSLRSQLNRIFEKALPDPEKWSNPDAIKKLAKVIEDHNGTGPVPDPRSIKDAVAEYRETGKFPTLRDLKYVCHGAWIALDDGWSVLGDPARLETLLAVAGNGNPWQKRRCFQYLLSCYWLFPLYKDDTPKSAREGWEKLRKWLDERLGIPQNSGERMPDWFTVIRDHSNLLKENPCDRYGKDLLNGDGSSLEKARSGLSIPGESWVMEEAILSRMRAAVALPDDDFKEHLDKLIAIASGTAEVMVSDGLKRRSIAMLVSRYARCADKPEHGALRDAAVAVIGNPWIRKSDWDTFVRDENARLMVNSWLKRRLISDFFLLLSEDGVADERRLEYWLRFEPAMDDVWLAFGPMAERNEYQHYKDLRKRADGRWLRLDNAGSAENNAFIMRLGDWTIVEFGVKGNACYIYKFPPPFELSSPGKVSLNKLKNKGVGKQLRHADRRSATWERKFDKIICPLIGYWPDEGFISPPNPPPRARPTPAPQARPTPPPVANAGFEEAKFWNLVRDHKLKTEDHRSRGGALWVKVAGFPDIEQKLGEWGFRYRDPRGWWRE